jgi:antitoxin MazE
MGNSVKSRIIKIGNSRGIRIPKVLLDQAKLSDDVEVEVQEDTLIIRSIGIPRQGWDKQFAEMAKRGDDRLLDSESTTLTSWDSEEWEWK